MPVVAKLAALDGPGILALARSAVRRSRAVSASAAELRAESRATREQVATDRARRGRPARRLGPAPG